MFIALTEKLLSWIKLVEMYMAVCVCLMLGRVVEEKKKIYFC